MTPMTNPVEILELTERSRVERLRGQLDQAAETGEVIARGSELVTRSAMLHAQRIAADHGARVGRANAAASQIATQLIDGHALGDAAKDYLRDFGQRMILMLDVLRERGDIFLAHEAAGCPPVLIYDYEVAVDARGFDHHPCNYMLLRIKAPDGLEVDPTKRPYVIIDPRAGHGAGIGGFKPDSQVGVALKRGHPVYFVAFTRDPVPGQTLADVTRAEAQFVRHVRRTHTEAPDPIVIGNCQGGWATMLLAATNPDIVGPIVLNGAPLSYWAGRVGENPMRYNGGMLGGVTPALVISDLSAGRFDGANLVANFELLSPSNTLFRKYYDVFAAPEKGRQRFLEFERWWGGFFFMNQEEIRWIVEQLFVGNRLGKNEARLEPGRHIDIKAIRAPVIVFASHGDNITPPQQALNWILDTYADENEIAICGQRIIYMVHEQGGHLGIFVSSTVAKREHSEMASVMQTIEALAPGLHEMVIEDVKGEGQDKHFTVSFHERTFDALRALGDGRVDETAFAPVARISEAMAEAYEGTLQPMVRAVGTEATARVLKDLHPARVSRAAFSSSNPAMAMVPKLAQQIAGTRPPIDPANPFVQAERLWADMVEQSWDLFRDLRSLAYEATFYGLYSGPWMQWYGRPKATQRTRKDKAELMALPEVQTALLSVEQGGFPEAVIRMLILLADSRGNVRRDRLERSAGVLSGDEPFASIGPVGRAQIIKVQNIVAHFDRDRAIETLPTLLPDQADRQRAVETVEYIAGAVAEMEPRTIQTLDRIRATLELAPLDKGTVGNPLLPSPEAAE
ncbi:MAG: alpha/beta fold hydrolase [Paracoccaceae bacterium]